MATPPDPSVLAAAIVDRLSVGIVTVDADLEVMQWNGFMVANTGRRADEVVGRSLFASFPELPAKWLTQKIRSVFVLKNFAFSSWRQRPYLFKFSHNRPVTGGVDWMRQDVTFVPIKDADGEVCAVCITLFDVTDASVTQLCAEEMGAALQTALVTVERMNNEDGLTGAFNRRHLDVRLAHEFQRFQRYGAPMSFILFDLDHFKRVNDRFGHQAGDEVLRAISSRIHGLVRDTDILARYGGEEFAVVLPETDLEGALAAAERMRHGAAASPVAFEGLVIPVTLSAGVSVARTEMSECTELVKEADRALYVCKANGRNRVHTIALARDRSGGDEQRGAA